MVPKFCLIVQSVIADSTSTLEIIHILLLNATHCAFIKVRLLTLFSLPRRCVCVFVFLIFEFVCCDKPTKGNNGRRGGW